MRNYLFLLLLLTACGTDPAKDSKEEPKNVAAPKYQETPHALAADELPKCDEDNQKQLVYVIPEKQFYTCEEKGWETIEMVMAEKQPQSVLWTDPVTDRQWYITGMSNQHLFCSDLGGDRVWERQNPAQVKEVLHHGIFGSERLKVWVDSNVFVYSDMPDSDQSDSQVNAFNLCLVAK